MARNDIFNLFHAELKRDADLVATDPHSLETIASITEEQELLISRAERLTEVDLRVDYSDFANFVYFNSALDYFNITGEKILNEYPYDAPADGLESFTRDLDGYQRHVLNVWPKSVGHLRFNPTISSSYVLVEDVGRDAGVSKTGMLSPNTGSLSVELWMHPVVLTGSDDVMVLLQKQSGSSGYTLYLTGSQVRYRVVSGSSTNEVSAPFSAQITYVAGVFDRSSHTGSISIITGSLAEFPVIVSSASIGVFGSLDLATVPLTIGSGSLTSKIVRPLTGSIDDVMVWKKARTLQELSSSFNVKHHSQENLIALYRFNMTGSITDGSTGRLALDYSGHKLDGRIQNYYPSMRGSGSLLLHEEPDPALSLHVPALSAYVLEQQTSASLYDRANSNKLVDRVPEEFLLLEEENNTTLLRDFMYVLGRHYDAIKLHIDQLVNVLRIDYADFDNAPDAVLDVVAKFFGWELTGNFLNADAFQYLLGRNVKANVQSNEPLDKKLFEIKNAFWRRVLSNLVYLYKTKGTRESVRALLRIYGVNDNFVRVKEFGIVPDVEMQTNRIFAEKSIASLGFGSGSLTASVRYGFHPNPVQRVEPNMSVEAHLRFPTTSSDDIQATQISGSIWSIVSGSNFFRLQYVKTTTASSTGSLILSQSNGAAVVLPNVGIFDNHLYHVAVRLDSLSSSYGAMIDVRRLDQDDIDMHLTASATSAVGTTASLETFILGATGSINAQMWAQEVKVWDRYLSDKELLDHTLNLQSYGLEDFNSNNDKLMLHWRLREEVTASIAGAIATVYDVTLNGRHGTGVGFDPSGNPYKRFLTEYNYIVPPDGGWNEDKIRTYDTTRLRRGDVAEDSRVVSLEFNMIDALNEDISQIMESLDSFNEILGAPSARYRVHYDDLERLRHTYFRRLQGRLNFRVFADMLEFFDRSFIDVVRRLIPARAHFIGDEFVVESHILERPKVTYERRRLQETLLTPEGRIEIWSRFGRNEDKSGPTFPLYLPKGN